MGGMTKAVDSGMPKLRIEESAARRQARIDRGEAVIVGVNKYRPAEKDTDDILDIDNAAVLKKQVERLHSIRAPRADDDRRTPPDPLTPASAAGTATPLALSVAPARAPATRHAP